MRPWHIRTQQEILDRIYDAVQRGDEGCEVHEYMRCAKFVPLVLRGVYEDTTELDWTDPELSATKVNACEITCDDVRAIDATAQALLPHFERALRRTVTAKGPIHQNRIRTLVRQYRAWKWLLGHEDADWFTITRTPLEIYSYLMKQMTAGQWSKMIGQVKKGKHDPPTPVNAQVAA